jgi:Protein of unknown function (DUF2384)
MTLAYSYPKSRYESANLVNINSVEERARLSESAVKGFFNIASKWQMKDEDARELLGGLPSSSFYELKKNPNKTLDVDRFTRISYLVGIYSALHSIYGDQLADAWIKIPNQNPLFKGSTPIDYMKNGGIVAMQFVRNLLDARRGGI